MNAEAAKQGVRICVDSPAAQVSIRFLCIIAAVFLLTFIAKPAEAWVRPYTYCPYGDSTCYNTREEAEAVIRLGNPENAFLEHNYSRLDVDGTMSLEYRIPNQPPALMGDLEYQSVGDVICELANTPSQYPGCATEAGAINGAIAELSRRNGDAGCFATDFVVSGSYDDPFSAVTAIGGIHDTGLIDYNAGSERKITYQYTCPTISETRFVRLLKHQYFKCGPGFMPALGMTHEEQLRRWPKKTYCYNLNGAWIQARLLQVKSCPANQNPCYPATGDKARFEPDFMFADRSFNHVYHSVRQFPSSAMGKVWRHTYQEHVLLTSSMNAYHYVDENGYAEIFTFQDSNASEAASNIASGRLMKRTPNHMDVGVVIISSDGDVRTFDRNGYLLKIENSANPRRNLSLAYRSQDVSNDGYITSATDYAGRAVSFDYTSDLLTKIRLPGGAVVEFEYDAAGNLVVARNENYTRTYQYSNIAGQLTGIGDESGGQYATFSYDSRGRVASSSLHTASGDVEKTTLNYVNDDQVDVRNENGENISYNISGGVYRRITGIASALGTVSSEFDGNYRVIKTIDRSGYVTSYEYLGANLSAENFAVGTIHERRKSYQFDGNGRWIKRSLFSKSSGGLSLVRLDSRSYDSAGHLTAECSADPAVSVAVNYTCGTAAVSPLGVRETRTTYCEQPAIDAGSCPLLGLVTSVDGPRTDVGDLTTYTYYPSDDATCAAAPTTCPHRKGDLWKVTNALGQVAETLRYDGAGRVLSVKDANGVVTDLDYHPRGWLAARKLRGSDNASETDDQITRIDYWPTGLVQQVTQPDGAFTRYTYDAAHRLTDIADNAGNTLHYTLDNAGNRVREDTRDAGGLLKRTLSRVYNQLGQLQTQADAQANPTDFTYDANGNPDTVTDALGRKTDHDYDPLNRLVRTLQDVGGIAAATRFEYDAQDNLTQVIDPKGLATAYQYTGLGDLARLASPDTGTTTFTYDSAGNRKTQADARNKTATYSYDALNRLGGIVYPTAGLNVTYTYDAINPACPAAERFPQGRLSKFKDGSGTTQYCYDRFGHLVRKVQTTNGKAFTLRSAYTRAGQLASLAYPDGVLVDYVRDAQGRTTEVGVTRPGGTREALVQQVAYAPFGPATGWTYGNGRRMQRPLNQNYQPTALQETGVGGLDLGLGFDAVGNLGTLTPAASPVPLASFGYDALNRLTHFRDGATGVAIETYAYDATGNRTSLINSTGTQAYVYPAGSHRLSKVGTVNRSYDAAGNTTQVGGTARQFVYSDSGRLKQAKAGGTVTMNYVYNGKGEQVRKYVGTVNTYTVYDEAGHWLGDYDSNGAALQQAVWLDDLPVGLLAGAAAAQRLHYVEPDHLGTPRVVIEPIRNVAIWKWDLKGEAFGNSVPNQDPDGDGTAFVFNLRFPGQRYDAASGLNYNYFRDYDPGSGRYVQSDPVGLIAGVSTYGYVSGSPLIWADMYGLLQWTTNPIIWSPTLVPGFQTHTFPGDGASTVTANSLARTTLDWSVSLACKCAAGGYSLDEYTVNFTPVVFLRQRYDSFEQRRDSRRAELDHVRDFNGWIGGARTAAQALEDSMKAQSFQSTAECENVARQAMQQLLQAGARQTAIDSHNRWDVSGRHTQVVPGP